MRLIDADAFKDWLLNHFSNPQDTLVLTLQGFIAEQPTAYYIDNVVEELNKASYLVSPKNKGHYADNAIDLEDATKIVKQGSVADDVCEWKYNYTEYYWESSCGHIHIFMADGPKENGYRYCPYCSKKIKVVK